MNHDLFDQGVLLDVDTKMWEPVRIIRQDITREDIGAQKEFIRNSKYLIDKKHLEVFKSSKNMLNELLDRMTIPFPMTGVKIIPKKMLERFLEEFGNIETRFKEAKQKFVEHIYPAARAEAEQALGTLFNPSDYPIDIASKFDISYKVFVLSPIGNGSLIDPSLVIEANKAFQSQMEQAARQVTSYLRTRFVELVTHLCERLSRGKTFKNTTVENLREFLNNFQGLNITNDVELETLVEQAKQLIGGTSPERIRASMGIQGHIEAGLKQVTQAMDSMLVNRTRTIIV